MNIIARIDNAAAEFAAARGGRAKYLYLGESELRELQDYVTANLGRPASVSTGAKVGGLYLFEVISPSHLAVS